MLATHEAAAEAERKHRQELRRETYCGLPSPYARARTLIDVLAYARQLHESFDAEWRPGDGSIDRR